MAKSRAELKARFQTNKIPSEADFANLIDAAINQADDGVRKSPGDPLNIKGEGTTQELLAFYKSFDDRQTPAWKINQNPGINPGLNIAAASGASRLFIDEKTGAVAIGSTNPVTTPMACMLQVGDESATDNNGQLLLVRAIGQGDRAYRFGVNDQYHLSIGDFWHKGNRKYDERLTIEHTTGRVSAKSGLEVNGLLEAKGNAIVSGTLDVNGTLNMNNGFNMKGGIMKWGTGPTASADPGIYSTTPGIYMRFATKGTPIMFFNNKGDDAVGGGEPNMTIAANGSVGIGTSSPVGITGSTILQVGDDNIDGSTGELIFGKRLGAGTRSFKMGLNSDFHFSVGDFGNKDSKIYREYLTINKDIGLVSVKKTLTVNGNAGVGTTSPFEIAGSSVLQIGDDNMEGSTGELIFGKMKGPTTRSFKMGMTADGSFSLGDFGNRGGKVYKEYLNVHWQSGNVGLGCIAQNRLDVEGTVHIAGVNEENTFTKQGAYITWNRLVGQGRTHFVNQGGTGNGGFMFENKPSRSAAFTVMAHLNDLGDLFLKGDYKGNGAIKDSSDIRIKRNIQSSDGVKDLALLNKLRITDYDYLAKGSSERKKGIIAQEVEKFIPEAISQDISFVADIFAEPAEISALGKEMLLTMTDPHHLVDGDMVRLILPHGDVERMVTVIDEKSFRAEGNADDFKDVLVYGKQVSDFRRVNYNHLFTLNLSATQELSKKIDTLLAWKASFDKNMILAD